MVEDSSIQRITRLTPLDAVLALIEAKVAPVKPQRWRTMVTYGRALAEDVVAAARPARPIALDDGFAVEAAAVRDASSYAPVALLAPSCRIEVGEPLPAGTDAVLRLDAVIFRGDRAEAIAGVAPGDGVLAAGGDASSATPLRPAGTKLRILDVAAMSAGGVEDAWVREPRIAAVPAGRHGPSLDAALSSLIGLVGVAGGSIRGGLHSLEEALTDRESDAVVSVGGTGSGASDCAVHTLARLGRVEVHGVAISPGETAAFGLVDARPVLLLPGRLDAAFAVWMLIGRPLLARLAGSGFADWTMTLPLKRKVTSTIGLTELIPVACAGGMAEPLGSGYLSLQALARSDGWIIVPPQSEGFAEGVPVAVRPWP